MTAISKNVELTIDADVLTTGAMAEVVNSLFEFLLYQRQQIPFVYGTFKYFVMKWSDFESGDLAITGKQFQILQKRKRAKATGTAIGEMREVIRTLFKSAEVKSLRFLFGATPHTPKEVYTIHIPNTSVKKNHYHEAHPISANALNRTLMSLLTLKDLHATFSSSLSPTNVFLQMELLNQESRDIMKLVDVQIRDETTLPSSCKDVHLRILHLSNKSHNTQHNCCGDLVVFDDTDICQGTPDNPAEVHNKSKKERSLEQLTIGSNWYEADIMVRGFKDQATKTCNIWGA